MKKGIRIICALAAVTFMLGGCGKEKGGGGKECGVHDWQWKSLSGPTCQEPYEVQEICARCECLGEKVTVGPDEHTWEDTVVSNGNCIDPKVISHVCSVCGAEQPNTVNYENRARMLHDFQSYSGSRVDREYNAVIYYQCDKCTRCGAEENRQQTGCEPIIPETAG